MSDLRERKFARTRLALARSLSAALRQQALADISVKQICREAEVSEATFFNYFPRKQDLMTYLAQLWLLELGWHVEQAADSVKGLAIVDQLFAHVAKSCVQHPGFFRELLSWLAHAGNVSEVTDLGETEKQLAFPDLEGIGAIPVKGVDAWMLPRVESAIHSSELPANTLVPALLLSLLTILFGVPLALAVSNPDKIATMYRQQLQVLWAGTRALTQRG